jgi:hypothetical protein
MSDEIFIICIETKKTSEPVARSIVGYCSRCKASVWVAPSTRNMMRRKKSAILLCRRCGSIEYQKGDHKIEIVPGQIAEIMLDRFLRSHKN